MRHTAPPPRRGVRALAVALAATLTGLALTVTACTGDSGDSSTSSGGGPAGEGATEAPPPLETTSTMGRVTGKLPKAKRGDVRQQVADAVDAWFDAAYVAGDYPRKDFASSWPGFTKGAAADARGDKALMSNQDIGKEISSVEATARKVTVDVLAVKGKPQGATARFVLKFTTVGDVHREIEVRGRLFLTPGAGGWQIFGYDVTKGVVA